MIDLKLTQPSSQDWKSTKSSRISRIPSRVSSTHSLDVSEAITWRGKRISNREALKVLRFILTKAVLSEEDFTELETFVALNCAEILLRSKDPSFLGKYSERIEALLDLFEYLRKDEDHIRKARAIIITLEFRAGCKILFSPNAYFGMKGNLKLKKYVVRDNANLRCKPIDPKRVGVGYNDKGNKKFVHLDGSPSWQEVAASKLSQTWYPPLRCDPKRYFRRDILKKFSG